MAANVLPRVAGCILSLAAGVMSIKAAIDFKSGLLTLMTFPIAHDVIEPSLLGIGIALVAFGGKVLSVLIFLPFTNHEPSETWELLSPALRERISDASQSKVRQVFVEGDLAFEALRVTSMPKERNLTLIRESTGARIEISPDLLAYSRKRQ